MNNLELLIRAWIRCSDQEKKHFKKMLHDMRVENRFQKSSVPILLRHEIFARDNHKCHYCGSNFRLTVDHKLAESKGGKTDAENLVTCCLACNRKKGTMDYEAFKKLTSKAA